jgi:hypothetical protein
MSKFGTNIKINVHPSLREKTQVFYQQGLDASHKSPRDGIDIFHLGDGFSIGVFYSDEALSEEQMLKGVWLELLVADPDATAAKLTALGGVAVVGLTAHKYIAAPGGLVYRLEKLA